MRKCLVDDPNTNEEEKKEDEVEVKEADYKRKNVEQRVVGQLQQQMRRETLGSALKRMCILCVYMHSSSSVIRCAALISKYGADILWPLMITMMTFGVPIAYLEISLGQFAALDPITLFGRLAPVAQGLGISMMWMSFWEMHFLLEGIIGYTHASINAFWWSTYFTPRCLFHFSGDSCLDPFMDCDLLNQNAKGDHSNAQGYYRKLLATSNQYKEENSQCIRNMRTVQANYDMLNARRMMSTASGVEMEYDNNLLNMIHFEEGTFPNSMNYNILAVMTICLVMVVGGGTLKKIEKSCYFVMATMVVHLIISQILIHWKAALEKDDGEEFILDHNVDYMDFAMWKACAEFIIITFKLGQAGLFTIGSFNHFSSNCLRDVVVVCGLSTLYPYVAAFHFERVWSIFSKNILPNKESNTLHAVVYENNPVHVEPTRFLNYITVSSVFQSNEATAVFTNGMFNAVSNLGIVVLILHALTITLKERVLWTKIDSNSIPTRLICLLSLIGLILPNCYYSMTWRDAIHFAMLRAAPVIIILELVVIIVFYGPTHTFVDFNIMLFPPTDKERNRRNRWKAYARVYNSLICLCWIVIVIPLCCGITYTRWQNVTNTDPELYTKQAKYWPDNETFWIVTALTLGPIFGVAFFKMCDVWFEGSHFMQIFHADMLYGPREEKYRTIIMSEHKQMFLNH